MTIEAQDFGMKKYTSYKYSIFEKMLDDWLGIDRNGQDGVSAITDYNSPRICKLSLAGCCPYSLLQRTRLAKRPCRYEVCPAPQALREAYQRDKSDMTHPYDQMLYDKLDEILTAADKRIQFSKKLKDSKGAELQQAPQIREMSKKIKNLLDESRKCGMAGEVARARTLLDQADVVKEQMAQKEQELMQEAPEQDSKITICEVCTAVIRQSDMEGRMAEHNVGRQHLAYLKMREVFETLKSSGIVSSRSKTKRRSASVLTTVRRLQPLD